MHVNRKASMFLSKCIHDACCFALCCLYCSATIILFVWLMNHQTSVFFSRNRSAINNHPTPIAEHEGGQRHLGNAIAIRAGGGLLVKCMSNSALTPTSPVHRPSCYGKRRSMRRPGPGAAGASGLACHLAIRRSGLRSPAPARHHATPAALGFGFITKSRGASSVVRLADDWQEDHKA